ELPDQADAQRVQGYGPGERFRLIRSRDLGPHRSDVLKFFRIADIFVLPSFVEGLPIALLEGMAMGLPVVSTNVFAIPEAIKHGETGLLIDPGDTDTLAKRITELASDKALRERLSAAGCAYVLEHFDERVAAQTAIEHYIRALNG